MEIALFIYLAGLADDLINFSTLGIFGVIIACFGYWIAVAEHMCKFPTKMLVILTVSFLMIRVFTPTERTMYMMAAGYMTQKVVTSEISEDLVKIVQLKIKKELTELQNTKK